jgi:hypothetical protein
MQRVIMPKFTAALIDNALMDLSDAQRLLEPLLNSGDLVTVQRASQALQKIHRSVDALKEVPRAYKRERQAATPPAA